MTQIEQLRKQLSAMSGEFAAALPSHIKPERFQRVVMTVVQQQPELLSADRRSLLAACTRCAADGLIPDGREAALVTFRARDGLRVQYMPMLAGLLKRMRNSGEIVALNVQVVYERDEFVWRPSDLDAPIMHRPPPLGTDRGKPIGAYAIAKLRDGSLMAEVMDRNEIERVRAASRAKDSGPWMAWWDQMARKTVLRRLAKYLPMDAETAALVQHDAEADAPPPIDTTATDTSASGMTAALAAVAVEAPNASEAPAEQAEKEAPAEPAEAPAEQSVEAEPVDLPAPVPGAGTIVEVMEEARVPPRLRESVLRAVRAINEAQKVWDVVDRPEWGKLLLTLEAFPTVKAALLDVARRKQGGGEP